MTQLRSFGAFTGQAYGPFGAKGAGKHKLTQLRAWGPYTGLRYGSFRGKPLADTEEPPVEPPVDPHDGGAIPWSTAHWGRPVPQHHLPVPQYLRQAHEEDELILIIIQKFLEELQKPRS